RRSVPAPGRHENHAAKERPAIEAWTAPMGAPLDAEASDPYSAIGHALAPLLELPRDPIAGGVRLQSRQGLSAQRDESARWRGVPIAWRRRSTSARLYRRCPLTSRATRGIFPARSSLFTQSAEMPSCAATFAVRIYFPLLILLVPLRAARGLA